MLTLILVLVLAAAVTAFVLVKKGKVADANNNNIPDVIEKPIEVVKSAIAEVKEEVKAKAKKPAAKKKPATKKAKKEQK